MEAISRCASIVANNDLHQWRSKMSSPYFRDEIGKMIKHQKEMKRQKDGFKANVVGALIYSSIILVLFLLYDINWKWFLLAPLAFGLFAASIFCTALIVLCIFLWFQWPLKMLLKRFS